MRSWRCKLFGLGIDILNVVNSIGRLLDHGCRSKPLPLVKDGDHIAAVQHTILSCRQFGLSPHVGSGAVKSRFTDG